MSTYKTIYVVNPGRLPTLQKSSFLIVKFEKTFTSHERTILASYLYCCKVLLLPFVLMHVCVYAYKYLCLFCIQNALSWYLFCTPNVFRWSLFKLQKLVIPWRLAGQPTAFDTVVHDMKCKLQLVWTLGLVPNCKMSVKTKTIFPIKRHNVAD